MNADSEAALTVEGLRTFFFTDDGIVKAVDGITFSVSPGETLGVVGESGCGKSVASLSIMRLLARPGRVVAGRVLVGGRNLLELSESAMAGVRGNDVAMVFQEPTTALNPVYRVGDQVAEALRVHRGLRRDVALQRAVELFDTVRIASPARRIRDYPHELSGGMRQRVMIAMALACSPSVLIADEPTTALDVTIQAQILALIQELQASHHMAVVMITHDLGVIAEVADRVVVMYAGRVVEAAPVDELFSRPLHPYTRALLDSVPGPARIGDRLPMIEGTVPHPLHLPPGCSFAPRCPHRFADGTCDRGFPELADAGDRRQVACYLHGSETGPRRSGAAAADLERLPMAPEPE